MSARDIAAAHVNQCMEAVQTHVDATAAWAVTALAHYEAGDNAAAERAVECMLDSDAAARRSLRLARRTADREHLPPPTMPSPTTKAATR